MTRALLKYTAVIVRVCMRRELCKNHPQALAVAHSVSAPGSLGTVVLVPAVSALLSVAF